MTRPARRLAALILAAAVAFVALAGSGCETHQDAAKGTRDTGPADLINMPDGYSNVAHKCDGPNMVYVIYHGDTADTPKPYGALAVVANDPRCAK
jgi:hypothetical protein